MKERRPKDIPRSIMQRLLNLARETKQEFNLILIRYGIERFLYRLSQSRHSDLFALKGAILFQLWAEAPHRPTRDVDLLGSGTPDPARIGDIIRDICQASIDNHGLTFLANSVRAERIREEEEYRGVRVTLQARLGTAKLQLQIDVGFGDAVTPRPTKRQLPCLLPDSAPPVLRVYAWETVVAEKYHAIVELGMTNSRMKDFFDLQYLTRQFSFDGSTLAKAIAATFERRKTDLPRSLPIGLSQAFVENADVQTRWVAFLRRSRLSDPQLTLRTCAAEIWTFLQPITESLVDGIQFKKSWKPGGPWT